MAQFTKNSKRNPLERSSSQGLVLGCPICAAKLDLLDTRDGDQAYWCHRCQSGWRAGNLPEAAHRSKDIAAPEQQVEAVTPAMEARMAGKARAAKAERDAAASASIAPRNDAKPLTARDQKQLATLAPLTRLRRHRTQGEAKKQAPVASRAAAKPLTAEVIAPKRRAIPRAPASEPKTVVVKPAIPSKLAPPKRVTSPRAADVVISMPKTAAPKQAQKKPSLETSRKDSRRAAQTVVPIAKPVKSKRQSLEANATPSRASPQKQALEIIASAPQPKRSTRPTLETAAPIKAPLPRVKRAEQPALAGKGLRTPAAPTPKAATGKRQPLEVAAKPKISTPRAAAPKPPKKTLLTVAPIKVPAKPSRRDKPALETMKRGSRKPVQIAAPMPKAMIGKRRKPEVTSPNVSAPRATAQKPQKKTLETAWVITRKARQPVLEPLPKPRRSSARIAEPLKPTRVVSQRQRKSSNVPVDQPRAQRPAAPLEPIFKSRRAPRIAAQPSPAPVKSLKPVPTKPEPTRAPRVTKQPAAVAPRPKPARSSPARPAPVAPSNPVQFGLFDALPPKTTPRRSAK